MTYKEKYICLGCTEDKKKFCKKGHYRYCAHYSFQANLEKINENELGFFRTALEKALNKRFKKELGKDAKIELVPLWGGKECMTKNKRQK